MPKMHYAINANILIISIRINKKPYSRTTTKATIKPQKMSQKNKNYLQTLKPHL